ncbi:hypothetical protein [Natrinema sp. 1APR25-10V2]|uniref:hypothetical protein n=1 Tax=Natrinema sp. 1APR25-10V2 TaxID=2951081 RepID=UPI002874A7ED|nr:hypothetical protein [Natrinema sp. 1APR25-10V2]MDS0475056.1 hypothetical protein [Natrinema sp. 1APR25-10V2]
MTDDATHSNESTNETDSNDSHMSDLSHGESDPPAATADQHPAAAAALGRRSLLKTVGAAVAGVTGIKLAPETATATTEADGQAYYAGIWEKRDGPAWRAHHGLTASQYQTKFDKYANDGYRLTDVSHYVRDGPASAALPSITGEFAGDKAGLYYIREVDSLVAGDPLVLWFGEAAQREVDGIDCKVPQFANVFRGRKEGSEIKGRWINVPKGVSANRAGETNTFEIRPRGRESMKLQRTAGPGLNDVLTSLPITECDGDTCEKEFGLRNSNAYGEELAAFEAWHSGARHGVTGLWESDDSGTYYIRELPHDGTVVWFGERTNNPERFSHVFWGERTGNTIEGVWADVPKADREPSSAGTLTVKIADGNLRRTNQSGGFRGRRWWRTQRLKGACGPWR